MTSLGMHFKSVNIFFLSIFVLEICINLFANWWKPFVKSPWNLLDTALVAAGILSTLGSQTVVLRLLRIARALRIFGKIDTLRRIIGALASSILPMASAFFILVILICVCETPAAAAKIMPPRRIALITIPFAARSRFSKRR